MEVFFLWLHQQKHKMYISQQQKVAQIFGELRSYQILWILNVQIFLRMEGFFYMIKTISPSLQFSGELDSYRIILVLIA